LKFGICDLLFICICNFGEKLIKAALNGNDPLGIMADLTKWNEQHPDGQIKQEELLTVIKLAFACHDLGNIAEKALIGPNNETRLVFLSQYKADGAEDRSQEITEIVIKASPMPEEQKARFLPLIQHLINETKFMPEKEAPFGIFSRVVDQIGNDLFNTNEERIVGLLEEMGAENPYAEFLPYFFFNFARERFGQLVPNDNERASILGIWGKELPEEKIGLSQEPIKVTEWLECRKNDKIITNPSRQT